MKLDPNFVNLHVGKKSTGDQPERTHGTEIQRQHPESDFRGDVLFPTYTEGLVGGSAPLPPVSIHTMPTP